MGTSINIHFEIKVSGKWEHYSSPYLNRNYNMFGWLAGVRLPENQEIEVKGLPTDISVVTLIDWENAEGHTPSYLTAEEITNWLKEFPHLVDSDPEINKFHPRIGYLFGNMFNSYYNYPTDYPPKIEDLRMVFWFNE